MSDLLFHKVSEKEREDIKKEAKRIMDSFSRKLEKVSDKMTPLGVYPEGHKPQNTECWGKEPLIEREKCERQEGEGKCCELDTLKGTSREIMFKNAPHSKGDFIVAERGGWR